MRKLVYLVATTLDGFIADPDRADPSGVVFELTGDHAEPLTREYPELVPTAFRSRVGLDGVPNRHFDTVLEGRGSYETGLRQGITDAYAHLRHLVFSTTLTELPAPDVELVRGDPVARVRELKAERPGPAESGESGNDIWLCGGGSLAAALRDEIDELHLKLNPVVVGSGTPLVDGPFQIDRYALIDSQVFGSGVALLRYARRT